MAMNEVVGLGRFRPHGNKGGAGALGCVRMRGWEEGRGREEV